MSLWTFFGLLFRIGSGLEAFRIHFGLGGPRLDFSFGATMGYVIVQHICGLGIYSFSALCVGHWMKNSNYRLLVALRASFASNPKP